MPTIAARFEEYDKKWLYDIKEDKLYKIIDDKEYEPKVTRDRSMTHVEVKVAL